MTSPHTPTPMEPFAAALLEWFDSHGRQLPWRGTRNPYLIWLSEIILQQTRISQGQAYWQRFVERWPTVEALAAASEQEVLRQWQGLGYYSRARHLHATARQVAAQGGFPTTLQGLRALKGVGDYTAAAIASLAFDVDAAVVDGNVYRVLARHFAIDTPINTTAGKHLFAQLAQQLLPTGRAAAYNQAIMDFGALQCTPKAPRCQECVLQTSCLAWAQGRVEDLPVKLHTLRVLTRAIEYVYVRCQGHTAIRQRGPGDIWEGLWEPVDITADDTVLAPQRSQLRLLRTGVRHVLTHRVLLANFYLLDTPVRPPLPPGYVWVSEAQIDDYALPRLVELLLEAVAEA